MTGPSPGPRPVLLVEDERSLLDAYRLVLEPLGLEVIAAESASEALRRLEDARPEAIVADLGLPDAGGPELLRALREAAPATPIVVLTGKDSSRARRAGRALEVADYLMKPVSGSELAERIVELIG